MTEIFLLRSSNGSAANAKHFTDRKSGFMTRLCQFTHFASDCFISPGTAVKPSDASYHLKEGMTWQLDDAILTNRNICIAYLSRSPLHFARMKFTLFASGDDPVGKYDTASLERYASQIVQEG